MAIGGSFNKAAFDQQDPIQMLWARRMWDWDTQNPFAKGVQQPMTVHGGGVSSGRQGVRMLNTQVPVGRIDQAVARPVNVLGSARNISAGGRNYGDQPIDRNEIERLKNTGSAFIQMARGMGEQQQAGTAGPTATTSQAPAPTPPTPGQQRRQTRRLAKQGVPAPPQPAQQQPKTLPAPVPATPHPNVSGKWREEQAHRIAEWELGEPGQPTPDPSVGSRSYLEEVARRRAERAGQPPAPTAPPATSAQRLERAGQLKAEREAAVAARGGRGPTPPGAVSNRRSPDLLPPNMRPGAVGTVKMPSPVGLAGGQAERLSAEGSVPATPPKRTRKKS